MVDQLAYQLIDHTAAKRYADSYKDLFILYMYTHMHVFVPWVSPLW